MNETSPQKIAVITGAASGLGRALTKACLSRGMHVVMADKDNATLYEQANLFQSTEKYTGIEPVVCDVTKADEVNQLAQFTLERFHRIDWLFNNAGVSGPLAPIWELNHEQIQQVFEVNLHGVIHGIQAFLPFMFKQSHRAHIINMASVYALCSGSQLSLYAMSKHALLALSESLHFDLARLKKPVDVSVVCPSFINTPLLKHSMPEQDNPLHDTMTELLAQSRDADDVAEQILRDVEKKIVYILPDAEVKNYCEQRTQAIIQQEPPHQHSLEKIIASLSKRCHR